MFTLARDPTNVNIPVVMLDSAKQENSQSITGCTRIRFSTLRRSKGE